MSTGGIETKGVPSTSIRTHTEVSTNGGSSFSTDTPTYNTETPTKKSLSTVTSTTTLVYQTTLVDASIGVPKRQMSTGGIETKGVPSTSIRTHTEVSTNGGSSFSTDTPTYNTETPTKTNLSTGTSTTTLAYQTTLVDSSIGVPKRQMSTGGIETKGVPSTSIRTRTETSTNGGSSFSTDTPTYTTKKSLSTGTSTMTLAYQTILDDGMLVWSILMTILIILILLKRWLQAKCRNCAHTQPEQLATTEQPATIPSATSTPAPISSPAIVHLHPAFSPLSFTPPSLATTPSTITSTPPDTAQCLTSALTSRSTPPASQAESIEMRTPPSLAKTPETPSTVTSAKPLLSQTSVSDNTRSKTAKKQLNL
ncbi:mucin-5AC-like [Crassostrea angulata]|uniref:mucin-5AC-like n=1 Tax=Magallana angulata TaxID=2784310 RepID=UPI0022B152BD|nr:mucin-5AC-like [Crassostrea angulata]